MSNAILRDYSKKSFAEVVHRFSNQISITSGAGVGSTTLFNRLKVSLSKESQPYRFVSGGGIFRARAAACGFDGSDAIETFAKHNLQHPENGHDKWCDETIAKFGEHNWMICEARLAHVFVPHAFHVYMSCEINIRVSRRHAGSHHRSVEEVRRLMIERDDDDHTRYESLYPGCHWNPTEFDLVIDTGEQSPERTEQILLEGHSKWLSRLPAENVIRAPAMLIAANGH